MDWRRRRDRKDYFLPEDRESIPELSEPSESTDSQQIIDEPKPSGVITVEDRLKADPDAYTLKPEPKSDIGISSADLDRQAREEAYRKAKAESDRIKAEQIAEGQDTVTHMGIQMTREQYKADFPEETVSDASKPSPFTFKTTLPDPTDFVGIPGPASKPAPGSIRESIDETLVKTEESILKFEGEMRQAGKQLGMEAQEAWKEGDVIEAVAKGTAAFSARAGTGIIEGVTFIARPIAIGRTVKGLVEGAKQAIEHPEEIPSGVQKWAEHVAYDPGSIAEFSGGIAGGYLTGSVIGEAYRSWKIRRLSKFYAEFPDEAFYIEDGIPDPRIPHPTDVERLVIKSKEQVRVIDDLGAGFLDEHKIATGSWPKSGTKGFGLRRTGHDLIPELIPEGMGRLETVYRFGLEYGQTHLPGVTGLPPYFEAALGRSSLSAYLSGVGMASSLITSITPDIDKPLTDSKPDIKQVTPTLDDTRIDETPRIIERVDETYKPKPDLIPPRFKTKPDPIIEPVLDPPFVVPLIDPVLEEDTDITTITIQDIFQEQKPIQEEIQDTILDLPPIIIPRYMRGVPKPGIKVPIKPPKKKRKRRMQKGLPPLGWEMRKYKMPTLEASKSNRKKPPSLKLPFPENKKKKKTRLPKL